VPSPTHFLEISLTTIIIVKHRKTAHSAMTQTGWFDTVAIACCVNVIILERRAVPRPTIGRE
jgi:hypothetical protein